MHHKVDDDDDDDEMTELVQYWVTLVVFEERQLQLLQTVIEVTITEETGEDDIEDWEGVLASAAL